MRQWQALFNPMSHAKYLALYSKLQGQLIVPVAGHPILPGERVAIGGREWSSLHGGAKRVFWDEYMRRFPA